MRPLAGNHSLLKHENFRVYTKSRETSPWLALQNANLNYQINDICNLVQFKQVMSFIKQQANSRSKNAFLFESKQQKDLPNLE
jgi:hypothetical protein